MPVGPSMAPWTSMKPQWKPMAHETILDSPKNAPPCLKGVRYMNVPRPHHSLMPIRLDFWGVLAHVTDEAKLHFAAIHMMELCVFFCFVRLPNDERSQKKTHQMVSILLTYPDAPCMEYLPTFTIFLAKCRWIFHKWSIRDINHQSHIKTLKSQHTCQCDYPYSPLLKYHPRIIYIFFFSGLCSRRFGNRNSLTEFPGNDFGRIRWWLTMMN